MQAFERGDEPSAAGFKAAVEAHRRGRLYLADAIDGAFDEAEDVEGQGQWVEKHEYEYEEIG